MRYRILTLVYVLAAFPALLAGAGWYFFSAWLGTLPVVSMVSLPLAFRSVTQQVVPAVTLSAIVFCGVVCLALPIARFVTGTNPLVPLRPQPAD